MQKLYCYVDESGTLPDPDDHVVIVAAIGTDMPECLTHIIQQVSKKVRFTKREIGHEMKFYHAGERTKKLYLNILADCPIDIFALIIQKEGLAIPDTPENFAVLCYVLLEECRTFYKNQFPSVLFDKHFNRTQDQDTFNQCLKELLGIDITITHVDSIQNSNVNAADMVAGSLLWKYTGRDLQFYNLIKDRIVSEQVLHWKEAKRKFFNQVLKKKNSA